MSNSSINRIIQPAVLTADSLGDMCVVPYGEPPEKLLKALAVIGNQLRPICDKYWQNDVWKDGCLLMSLILRDFLFKIGFTEAEARPCAMLLEARSISRDEMLHSIGVGVPGQKDNYLRWGGHMVTVLPKSGWLIDATIWQMQRPQWSMLSGMLACPTGPGPGHETHPWGKILGAFAGKENADTIVRGVWIDRPSNNRWRTAPIVGRGGERERFRRMAVADLVAAFNEEQSR